MEPKMMNRTHTVSILRPYSRWNSVRLVPEFLHSGFYWSYRWRRWWWQVFAKLQSNHHHQQTNTNFLQAGCPSCHPSTRDVVLEACASARGGLEAVV